LFTFFEGSTAGINSAYLLSAMILEQLFDRESSTFTYLLADPETRQAALIDPVLGQVERDLRLLQELDLHLVYVLETHVHADHVTAASELRTRTGAKTCASERGAPCVDAPLRHADVVRLGELTITALSTPGHTDDGLSYLACGHIFTGDTLLIRGCGRADFQNGDAGQLYDSITRVLFRLPPETIVLPGHDYKGFSRSTIANEIAHNPRIVGKDKAAFVDLMNSLNLPPPAKLAEAVPANRACGKVESP
jgi:sulfur dioxygenase